MALVLLIGFCSRFFRTDFNSSSLMPALQSHWFAPHVISYICCYTLQGAATILAFFSLATSKQFAITYKLAYAGTAFMTIGMLLGALWAQEAWGAYWSWDPKENWAAATWICYLLYLHMHLLPWPKRSVKVGHWMLIISFCCLQMCWWGINYLPSAQQNSMHTYSKR
ncbi:MAG: cytochrome c biogenesis protein CcsA [Bacteroidales bacterium]|nr:cytochrome c biogenesis protein CcsA [Bacteroidales bacterium]